MRDNIISFPCDPGTQAFISEMQKRFTARNPREPVSRSSVIRFLIDKGAECVFSASDYATLLKKGQPVKWGGRSRKKRRSK